MIFVRVPGVLVGYVFKAPAEVAQFHSRTVPDPDERRGRWSGECAAGDLMVVDEEAVEAAVTAHR